MQLFLFIDELSNESSHIIIMSHASKIDNQKVFWKIKSLKKNQKH